MYQIFESQLYQQVILEATPKSIEEEPLDEEPLDEEIPEETPPTEEDPLAGSEEDPLADPDQPPTEEEARKTNFQAIQKYILYHKLRELQYKLDDLSIIKTYKDKDKIIRFNKFLSYVIMFFSIFDYKQASKLTEQILIEFKKIK